MTREDAIEVLENLKVCKQAHTLFNIEKEAVDMAIEAMKEQRPHGEWTYTTHYARRFRVCSVCKVEKEDDHASGWNYCQYCGASMKKEGEEE